ncbi:MAG: response regulator transcription factor [Spirochaetales bacterium]|nr:response regulator transcription factor [Spirochaetales bacterium]
MINDLIFISYILAVIIGGISIFSSIIVYMYYRKKWLFSFILTLASFYAIIFFYTGFHFFYQYSEKPIAEMNSVFIVTLAYLTGLLIFFLFRTLDIIFIKIKNLKNLIIQIILLFLYFFLITLDLILFRKLVLFGILILLVTALTVGTIRVWLNRKLFKTDSLLRIVPCLFLSFMIFTPLEILEYIFRQHDLFKQSDFPVGAVSLSLYTLVFGSFNLIFNIKQLLINSAERTFAPISEKYRHYGISKREIQVINLMKEGLSNKEIADKLTVSIRTVDKHLYNIYNKCQVNNRVELIQVLNSNNIDK